MEFHAWYGVAVAEPRRSSERGVHFFQPHEAEDLLSIDLFDEVPLGGESACGREGRF